MGNLIKQSSKNNSVSSQKLLPSPTTNKLIVYTSSTLSRKERFSRPIKIVWTLFTFLFYVYLDFKGWLKGSEKSREAKLRVQAQKLGERLLSLGPTFIKIGQALSTRADLLPVAYIDELSKLQDRVPAFSNLEAFSIIEQELASHPKELFKEISSNPIAAASLGQVYRAYLKTGEEVAVKIQRPNLSIIIKFDLLILRRIIKFLLKHTSWMMKGNDWLGMLDEFERVINEELDYQLEGTNADRFRVNFADWSGIHVPKIYWEYTTSRVITMEFISGTKIIDIESLEKSGFSAKKINELMHRTYFKQLLEDGFFHADPHPGNLLVMPNGKLAFFDFGMVGNISSTLQQQMVSAFFHILERDFDGLVDDLISLNFLKPEVNIPEFRKVIRDMFARKIDLDLSQVNFKELTYEIGEIIYKYPISTPAAFTFIIRALMTLEGISIQMNPTFNFLEVAKPYASDFLFRKESAHLRKQVWENLREVGSGKVNWGRLAQLAKLGWQLWAEPKINRFLYGDKPK
ncbi:MAG: AarF/ABC1/UbiB kinase family protein [Blastocatellia bacterium]|nr:AarF/ABC1/UbiB kinase family protein [Blastocatellia bacterium]MBN8723138.1 AarF/ABC1/UbiB kinase family protein [Acidobacteriota bacterium]